MRFLIFSSCPSYPAHAGNSARVAAVGERLQKLGHSVHFLYFDHQSPMTLEEREGMIRQWHSFQHIPFHKHGRPDRKGQPWHADDWFQADIGLHVRSICNALQPDVVICNYAFHSKLFDFVNENAIRIIDTHDVFSDRHLMLDAAGLPRRFYFTDRTNEALQLRRADLILSIQRRETEFFESIVSTPVATVGHLMEKVIVQHPVNDMLRVGFIASANHLNQQALNNFLDEAAKDLAAGVYELVVAGSVCDSLADLPGLTKLKRVESIGHFYSFVDAVINPMEHGTGLKIKTVEALQHGVPLVSTACGFDGLHSDEDYHGLPDAAAVARRVGLLARHQALLAPLAKASHRIFESYAGTQVSTFDALFESRDSLENFLGGRPVVADRRNQAARKVLIATHARFWRSGMGSHLRIKQLVEELSRHYQVLVFATFELSPEDASEIANLGLPVEIVGVEVKIPPSYEDKEELLLGRIPHKEIFDCFERVVGSYRPSVCIVEYLRLSFLLKALPSYTVRIIDTHDLISRRQESRSRIEGSVQVKRTSEIRALAAYDYILTIQRTEAAVADCWTKGNNVLYVPLVFDERRGIQETHNQGLAVGFIGADNAANFSAISWFLEQVWPYFSQTGTRLRLAGNIVNRFDEPIEGVDLVGPTDLDEFYSSIGVAINPAQWGGGLKIKTVEALAYGLPVVCTPEGAAGLEEADGLGLAVAQSGAKFAYVLNKLIESPELRGQQGKAGRLFTSSEFRRETVFRDLHAVIQSSSPSWLTRIDYRHG